MNWFSPLFSLTRNGIPELTLFGEIEVFDGKRTIFSTAAYKLKYPARSLLKPFQFFSTGLEVDKKFMTCLGSISATQEQVSSIEKWASQADPNTLSQLKLPPSYPMDENFRVFKNNVLDNL